MDLDQVVVRFAPDLHYEPPREWLTGANVVGLFAWGKKAVSLVPQRLTRTSVD
jgi:hypothetical protein